MTRRRTTQTLRLLLFGATVAPCATALQTFGAPEHVELPGRPSGLGAADLDGDGAVDLVACLRGLDRVAVLRSQGAELGPVELFASAGAGPIDVAVGDVDADGLLDLVTADRDGDGVGLLFGTGDWSAPQAAFGGAATISTPGAPIQVRLGDLDLDGDLDLIVGSETGESLRLLANDGAGAFAQPLVFAAGGPVRDLCIGDLDGDGLDEILAAAEWGGTRLLRNQGGFDFVEALGPSTFGGFTDSLDLADADGDGDLDLAWVEEDGIDSDVEIAPNIGGGVLSSSQSEWVLITVEEYDRVRLGQLDGDGDPDLVAIGSSSYFGAPSGWLHLRHGAGGIGFAGFESFELPSLLRDLELVDLNGDGFDELVVSEAGEDRVTVYPNLACGLLPSIASTSLDQLTVVPVPGSWLELTGCGLGAVTACSIAGQSTAITTSAAGATLAVELPPSLPLGPVDLVLEHPSGPFGVTLPCVPVEAPALALDPPSELPIQASATLHVAGDPSGAAFLGASWVLAPSLLPGVLELGIGAGFTALVSLGSVALDPLSGAAQVAIATATLPIGQTFHLQAVVVGASSAWPLPTTQVVTARVVQ